MIIVASHINYNQAWGYLRESMVEHQQDMSDVVVVVAGASEEKIVTTDDNSEVYIYIPLNFYELTAIYGAYKYMDHPRLANAKSFLLVHDTSVVLPGFPQKYSEVSAMMDRDNLELLYFTPTRQLNQLLISREFLKKYGHSWGRNGTKEDAWKGERDGIYSCYYLADHSRVRAIGDQIAFNPAVRYNGSDIYRHPVYITPLNLVKFVANNDAHVNPHWSERNRP